MTQSLSSKGSALGTPFLEYVTNLGLIYSLKLESAFQIYAIIGLIMILNVKAPFAHVVMKMKHVLFFSMLPTLCNSTLCTS